MNSMNQPPTCDLSIVIVSWNVWPLLKRCLASIERVSAPGEGGVRWLQRGGEGEAPNLQSAIYNLQSATLEVIVVDNASHDDTPAQIAAHFPWARVIASDKNLGFTGGNNRGFAASHGRFIYFLNPDTELTYLQSPISQSLFALYAAITPDPTIGVIGPQLRYADGAPQPSARRFPTPWTGIFESTWLGRAWPSNPWARKLLMADWPADRAGEVDWLVGAALLCRREALDAVATPGGPFDEGFFMYSEELDLCRRIQQAGWRIVYEPTALVIHHEGKSSEQVSTQRHIRFNTSKVRYWRKWFGPRWGEALRRYLLLEYRVQIGVEQVKLWLGQKPALRRERIAAYRAVIESGLRGTICCWRGARRARASAAIHPPRPSSSAPANTCWKSRLSCSRKRTAPAGTPASMSTTPHDG
jgi:GT2 family glycosyltransferase